MSNLSNLNLGDRRKIKKEKESIAQRAQRMIIGKKIERIHRAEFAENAEEK